MALDYRIDEVRGAFITDAYRFSRAVLLVFLAASVDIFNYLDRGGSLRYLLLLVPVGSIVLARIRSSSLLIRRPALSDRILLPLWLIGLGGSLYGAYVLRLPATTRPIFIPMGIAFLYLLVLDTPTEREVGRLLRAIGAIAALYVALSVVINTGMIPGLEAHRQFRNASFAVVTVAMTAAIFQRQRFRLVVLVGLVAMNFLAYPSATSVLVIMGMILTLFMTRPSASSLRPYLVGAVLAATVLLGLSHLSTALGVTNEYFALVKKSNDNATRLALWSAGISQFEQSPFVGMAFSGGTLTIATRVSGIGTFQLPYHNDYVLFLAEGGILGFGMLVAWIITFEFTIAGRCREFFRTGRATRANLLRVLLVGFNGFVLAAAFNPVLEAVSMSATIFGFYAIAMVLGRSRPPHRESAGAAQMVPGGRAGFW